MAEDTDVSRLEDVSTWEDLEALAAYKDSQDERSVEQSIEQPPQESTPLPDQEFLELDGQKVARDQLLQEYQLLKKQADQLAKYTTLLRTLEDRSLHPKWRAAFNALLDPNWESHVVDEGDEGEEEEEEEDVFELFGESKPSPQPKRTKAPEVPSVVAEKINEVEARLAQIERAKAERDLVSYIEAFEKQYGKLSPEDFKSLEETADKYRVLGPQGWWTPEHGNPIEVIARLDPKLSSKVLGNGTKLDNQGGERQEGEHIEQRQAKQKRMAQGSSVKEEVRGKKDISSALDELEAALRRSMRYIS